MNNNSNAWIWWGVLVIVVLGIAAWALFYTSPATIDLGTNTATTTDTTADTTHVPHINDTNVAGIKSFVDWQGTISFDYPSAFVVLRTEPNATTEWMANATSSGMLLAALSVPASLQPKTNFSEARFTVGVSKEATALSQCLSYNPAGPSQVGTNVTINGVVFKKFVASEGAAGNIYDTTSYRAIHSGQCYVVEYTIHSTQLGNYPASAGIKAYDKAKVTTQLESVVKTFKFI